MARVILAIALLATALIPGGQASTLRTRKIHARDRSPADSFRKNFGWPGFNFPADKWGVVMDSSEVEKAAAAAASSTIVSPNLGSAPVNIAPSPSSTPLAISTPIVSATPQDVSTSQGLADISQSNTTTLSSSPSSVPKPTVHSVTPVSAVKSSSSSVVPPPPSSHSSLIKVSSQVTPPSSSSTVVPSPSQAPSHSASPPPQPSSSSPSAAQAPPPSQQAPPAAAPVNVGSGNAGSNQGGQGNGSNDSNSSSGSGPTSAADIQAYLTGHNTARAQHGAAPLTYSQSLAAKAQQWANGCVFKHSGGTLGPFGENLAAGTGSGYGIAQAIGSWVAEASQYNPNSPVASHFTQVVWKGTTEVGCALQECSGIFPASFGLAQYYVCEYSPAGNVEGEFAANVQA